MIYDWIALSCVFTRIFVLTQYPVIAQKLGKGMLKILNALPPSTIASLGTYPSSEVEPYVSEKVTWTKIVDKKAEFERFLALFEH